MNILGIDLTSVPWPLFLLILFVFVIGLLYINIHIPMVDELDTIKKERNTEFKIVQDLISKINIDIVKITTALTKNRKDLNELFNMMRRMDTNLRTGEFKCANFEPEPDKNKHSNNYTEMLDELEQRLTDKLSEIVDENG